MIKDYIKPTIPMLVCCFLLPSVCAVAQENEEKNSHDEQNDVKPIKGVKVHEFILAKREASDSESLQNYYFEYRTN